jgi:RNA polymerase sigma-70 factor (ECF subfamily)
MTIDTSPATIDLAGMVRLHQAGVWRYLRVLGCSAAEADDLTQETFLAVLERPFQEYTPAATAAYLRKVARNLLISLRRRNARLIVMEDLDGLDAAWSRWAGDDGGQNLLATLEACFQKLTERARRALELRFRDRSSRAEIAASVGLSEDGAKNLMQRAKRQLRECIERHVR